MLINQLVVEPNAILFRVLLSLPYILLAVYVCRSGIMYVQTKNLANCEAYFMKAFWAFMCVTALLLCLFLSSHQAETLLSSHLFFSLYFTGIFALCLVKPALSYRYKLMLLGLVPFSLLICFFIL